MDRTGHCRLTDVSKRYGDAVALRKVNLDIPAGHYCCLVGPSGCGKTSTLRLIAGHETVSDGSVTIDDVRMNEREPAQRPTAMMFQDYALFPHLNCLDNVAFSLKMGGVSKSERHVRARELLALVHMEEYEKRLPNQLSGGQQQRVALARALVFEPNLLLMDEPLGALDKKLREQMQIEIKHLHEALGTTVVYVTHDQAEALTMSDRVAVMDEGRIQQTGTPQEIYERPDSSFVANFIGENNNLDGTVERIDGDDCEVRLVSGDIVVARRVGVSQVGDRTTVSVRPEQLEINPNGEAHPNRFQSEVVEVIYFGDHNSLRLAVAGRDDIIAKVSAIDSGDKISSGDSVEVGWASHHCRALDPL